MMKFVLIAALAVVALQVEATPTPGYIVLPGGVGIPVGVDALRFLRRLVEGSVRLGLNIPEGEDFSLEDHVINAILDGSLTIDALKERLLGIKPATTPAPPPPQDEITVIVK